MSTTSWVLVGLVALLGFVALLVLLPAGIHRVIGPSLRRRVAAVYPPDQVVLDDVRALTLGVESKGVWQGRGNGALVLTADELAWFQFVPQRVVRILRRSITAVGTVRSHLGKSYGRDLLHVAYTDDGRPDSMAWVVVDLDDWLAALGTSVADD